MRAIPIAHLVVVGCALALAPNMAAQTVYFTSSPMISYADDHSAVITWNTNAPSDSSVWYGTDKNNITQSAEAPSTGTTRHEVRLNNLRPGTAYFIKVESARTASSEAESCGIRSFRTPSTGQPAIRNQVIPVVEKCASPKGDAASHEREDQAHMEAAIQHLKQAQAELQKAEHDKGGHRVKAIQLTEQAEREVQAGINYDSQHETERRY